MFELLLTVGELVVLAAEGVVRFAGWVAGDRRQS